MKSLFINLPVVLAGANDFPPFDPTHCHCQTKTEISGTCHEVWISISNTIKTMADPGQGTYKIYEEV